MTRITRAGRGLTQVLSALLLVLLLGFSPTARAEPRVALVIGNSGYGAAIGRLANPANDARLIASTLRGIGFTVIEVEDADLRHMKRAIVDFGAKLSDAGKEATGLFYYAGHGLQSSGENYLIPIGAAIDRETDLDIEAVPATLVLKQMDFADSAVNIVILDACRNNPLSNGARGMTRGLAEIKSTPRGSFIAYSTAPGSTAADGDGRNSPYTKALAETITEPGLSISDVFQEVRSKVLAETGQQQTPWDSSSLTGRFYFKPPEATQSAALTPPPAGEVDELAVEKAYWDSVKDSDDPDAIQLYLSKYPGGYFVDLANAKLVQLKGTQVASAATESDRSTVGSAQNDSKTVQPPQPTTASFVAGSALVYAKGGGQVRAQPDGNAALLAKLKTNTEVQSTGRSDDGKWWRVTLADGRTGYMHASVVSTQPIQTASAQPAQQQNDGYVTQGVAQGAGGAVATDPNAIQMVDGGGQQTAVQTAPAIDPQAASQLAGAMQNPTSLGNVLGSLLNGGVPQQQQQTTQVPQPLVFQQINRPVSLRPGALILNAPNGATIAQVKETTQIVASGEASNWLQVQLPNGSVGYVAKNWVAR